MLTTRPYVASPSLLRACLALLALLFIGCNRHDAATMAPEAMAVAQTEIPAPTASPLPTQATPTATPTVPPPTDTPAPPTETPPPAQPTNTPEPTATEPPTREPYRPPNGPVSADPADAQLPDSVRRTTVLVKNGTDSDALVILLNRRTGGKRAAYIWAGRSVEMRLGGCEDTYEIYFSKGADWDEARHAFTRNVIYEKFEDTLACAEHGQDVSYELTLYAVAGGNVATERVPPEQFPGL
ncbi:MAG: hypothetical protein ACUVX9_06905 [Anaerolineae bacterium]